MWLVPRPFCHVTVVLSDDQAVRKAAGLPAEAPKPLVKKKPGRLAQAVAGAGTRAKAEKHAAKPEKAPKSDKKSKKS